MAPFCFDKVLGQQGRACIRAMHPFTSRDATSVPTYFNVNGGVYRAFNLLRPSELKGGCMRKIMVTLIVASLLPATSAAPVFADGWGGYSHGRDCGFNPLWPIAAALAIPAAIIGAVAQLPVPVPGGYVHATPPAPVVYARPATYYAPQPFYAPRAYVPPGRCYAQRPYHPPRDYRYERSGW